MPIAFAPAILRRRENCVVGFEKETAARASVVSCTDHHSAILMKAVECKNKKASLNSCEEIDFWYIAAPK